MSDPAAFPRSPAAVPAPALYRVWAGLCIAWPAVLLVSLGAANLLLAPIILGWLVFRPAVPRPVRHLGLLAGLYLVATLAAVALSPFGSHWAAWLEGRSTMLAILPGLVLGADLRRLQRSLQAVAVLLVALAGYGLYQHFTGWDPVRGKVLADLLDRWHATGFQELHLTFAGLVGMAVPVVLSSYAHRPVKSGLLALAGTVAVLTAMARSIMLGLAGCGLLLLAFGSRRLKIAALVLLLALALLPSTIFDTAGERFLRGVGMSQDQTVSQGDDTRLHLWHSAWTIFRHFPLLGVGGDNWPPAFQLYGDPYDNYSSTAGAHNDLLTNLTENGLLGTALFAFLWGYIVLQLALSAWRSRGEERDRFLGFLGAVLLLLFGGLFQDFQADAETALLLWCLVGAGIQLSAACGEAAVTVEKRAA
ncbi:MAG: O-antigen ligase domain-containing protein [Candidatus Zixiibacteriota bacterium]|nr:MAG: O-antigen ligase domain-containing protein [candidate division Zixibacteria bacterium]